MEKAAINSILEGKSARDVFLNEGKSVGSVFVDFIEDALDVTVFAGNLAIETELDSDGEVDKVYGKILAKDSKSFSVLGSRASEKVLDALFSYLVKLTKGSGIEEKYNCQILWDRVYYDPHLEFVINILPEA